VLTNDFEYFGQRTMSGDRPKESDAVIVADFGSEWGQMVVSRARVPPNIAAELHRSLSLAFIERRSGHLSRIAAQNRAQRSEAAAPREKRILETLLLRRWLVWRTAGSCAAGAASTERREVIRPFTLLGSNRLGRPETS
jgi:hypothetical protein